MLTKRCSRCGTKKEAAQFYPEKRAKEGLHAWCKACARDYQRDKRRARATVIPSRPPEAREFFTDEFLPNVLIIPIRPDRAVMVGNIPADLTSAEADRIERIVKALVVDDVTRGEP
jgi:hypothetical protein